MTGARRNRDGAVEAIFVARYQPDGSLTRAGAVELGLRRKLVEHLEGRLAGLPARQRGAVAWYPAALSVVASLHGPADGRCVTRCRVRCPTAELAGCTLARSHEPQLP